MTPNPYQSPREAGYDAPRPPGLPLWRKLVRIALVVMLLVHGSFAIQYLILRFWF